MRRLIPLLLIALLLAAALIYAEKEKIDAPVGAYSLLHMLGDSQRDLTRMPSEFTRLSDEEETKLGNQIAKDFLDARLTSVVDKEAEAMIEATAARLSRHKKRRIPIKAYYYPGEFNAFALPGGSIFIGGDLLAAMETQDQLAAVMAHEIEHVDHYHCAERLQVEAALRKIPLGMAVQIPVEVFRAGYSKNEELEADREGVLLAARAGYSSGGAVDMFTLLAERSGPESTHASTPQEEVAHVAASAITGYFRSHPLHEERIAQIRTMIAREPSLAGREQTPLPWKSRDGAAKERP